MKQISHRVQRGGILAPGASLVKKGKNNRGVASQYFHNHIDHRTLFRLVTQIEGAALLTYDDSVEVRRLAADNVFYPYGVAMKNTHHAEMSELAISNIPLSNLMPELPPSEALLCEDSSKRDRRRRGGS